MWHCLFHSICDANLIRNIEELLLEKNIEKLAVPKIYKEIAIKAVREYLDQPVNPDLPKRKFSQANIARKTGISAPTFGRYINSEEVGSCPSFAELMEILEVVNKREYLLDFARKSNCKAAKFIKATYPNYINANPINEEEVTNENEEVLRLTNQSHSKLEKSFKFISNNIMAILMVMMFMGFTLVRLNQNTIIKMLAEITKSIQ
jgi:hypothetical protein